ncbi:hypothetical protein M3E00_07910 [Dietzia cinnamea]|uniref:RCC1 domain-containing protein n=1 Tax=Dietzia TaxID=37914 RepID=UPI0007835F41|nr:MULTISPECIES: hypothetical protein [Dietzia]KZO57950.1 hypothetical protein A2U19_14550 [Dietzia maris]MCT2059970.1 hypothetical protein [Dietzia cinnamea]MCT2098518.1 hypothetical protein [Dietzia cinnamea]
MRIPRRAVTVTTAVCLALGGTTACSPADRAVLFASACSDSTAFPTAPRHEPGQAHLIGQVIRSGLPMGPVPGWDDVVSVADAGTTLAAVHAGGTVSVVGVDHDGLLAGTAGGAGQTLLPRRVSGISDAISVAAVGSAFLVTHADGTVSGWGDSFIASGALRGDSPVRTTPAAVQGVDEVVSVAAGSLSALALRSDGGVLGWGVNLTEILGEPPGTTVRRIRDVPGAVSVADASGAAVIATATGEVCAWGNNVHGLLGVEPRGGQTNRPVRVDGFGDAGVVQVAGGQHFALALDSAGTVWTWGRTVTGILGDGTTDDTVLSSPRPVPGLPPLRWVGASESSPYGIDGAGALWSWGRGPVRSPEPARDTRPRRVPLAGPAQTVSGALVLLAPGD